MSRRFFGSPELKDVRLGLATVGPGAQGAYVKKVQQALLDIGFKLPRRGADGGFGPETVKALQRFQREMGLPRTGTLDKATLAALDRVAPAPGKVLERFPEYDKLFKDGRLNITIAQGYQEKKTTSASMRQFDDGLRAQGFHRIRPETMSASERTRLGLGPDRFEPGASYYVKQVTDPASKKPADVVVKFITPISAATPEGARDMFQRALERDEVVMYDGHARYGTGPDFHKMESGRGNFVIDRDGGPDGHPHQPLTGALHGKPESMLPAVKPFAGEYQLLFFNACTTENYMDNLRDSGKFHGHDNKNTDILGTTIPGLIATGPDHVLGLVSTLSSHGSINDWEAAEGKREAQQIERLNSAGYARSQLGGVDTKDANGMFLGSGFVENQGNRVR